MSLALIRPKSGLCAGAIASMAGINHVETVGYNQKFPTRLFREGEQIYLLGVVFQEEEMLKLTEACDVTFIDHHVENFKALSEMDVPNLTVIGSPEVPLSVQTWKHFNNDTPVPDVVTYHGRYMVWDLDDDVIAFNYGLLPMRENLQAWKDLLTAENPLFATVMSKGRMFANYMTLWIKQIAEALAYRTTIHGIPAIAINTRLPDSLVFNYADTEGAKLGIWYQWQHRRSDDGFAGEYCVSIARLPGVEDVDCAEIAQRFDGGGFAAVANFRCRGLPFQQHGDTRPVSRALARGAKSTDLLSQLNTRWKDFFTHNTEDMPTLQQFTDAAWLSHKVKNPHVGLDGNWWCSSDLNTLFDSDKELIQIYTRQLAQHQDRWDSRAIVFYDDKPVVLPINDTTSDPDGIPIAPTIDTKCGYSEEARTPLDSFIGMLRGRRMWAQVFTTVDGVAVVALNAVSSDWPVDKRYVNAAQLRITWCWMPYGVDGAYRMLVEQLDPSIDVDEWLHNNIDCHSFEKLANGTWCVWVQCSSMLLTLCLDDDIPF